MDLEITKKLEKLKKLQFKWKYKYNDLEELSFLFKSFDKFEALNEKEKETLIDRFDRLNAKPEIKEITDFVFYMFERKEGLLKEATHKKSLIEKLEEVYDIADSKTKRMITNFKTSSLNIKELEEQYTNIMNRVDYTTCRQSGTMNDLIYFLHSKKKMNDLCIFDFFSGHGTLKTKNLEYTLEYFNNYKDVFSITTIKLFIYAVSLIDFTTNKSEFTFVDYATSTNISLQTKNRKQLERDLSILKSITNLKYVNRKKDLVIWDSLIYGGIYEKGKVSINWNPNFVNSLKDTYMYFPESLLKLKGKENTKVFIFGWYIFTQLRINFTNELTRSVSKCLEKLDFPSVEDIRNNKNRRYQDFLIEPFENLIDTLNELIPELHITFDRDYDKIGDFLKSLLKIELRNNVITEKYRLQEQSKNKKKIKNNIDKKLKNTTLAKQYKKDGLTTKEISEKLNLSTRTIKRYFGQR